MHGVKQNQYVMHMMQIDERKPVERNYALILIGYYE